MIIHGFFNDKGEPVTTLDLLSVSIEVLIDTGFAGGLIVPQAIANDLSLHFEGFDEFRTVTGEEFTAPAYSVVANWFGDELTIPIAVSSEVSEALLGSQMLLDCRLTIDYAQRTVKIEKPTGVQSS